MQVMLNGSPHRFDPPPATVAELVRALNLEGKRIAVEMNGEIVPKSRYATNAGRCRRPARGRGRGRRRIGEAGKPGADPLSFPPA